MSWWVPLVMGAVSYFGQKDANKAADKNSRPQESTSYRTPYMNEYLKAIAPWIMAESQRVYNSRQGIYGGGTPTDFSPIQAMLGQIPANYSGVGEAGGMYGGPAGVSPVNPFAPNYGQSGDPAQGSSGVGEFLAMRGWSRDPQTGQLVRPDQTGGYGGNSMNFRQYSPNSTNGYVNGRTVGKSFYTR